MSDDLNKDIIRRLQNLETHLINFIVPMQEIHSFLKSPYDRNELLNFIKEMTRNPLQINERPFNAMTENISVLRKDVKDLSHKIDTFEEKTNNLDIGQTMSEIKYIGKRLLEIEDILKKVDKEGLSKKVNLEFTVDGYELVKRKKLIQEDAIENSDQELIDILSTITNRERLAIVRRLGLLGGAAGTYDAVGKTLVVTRERARQIYAKGLRKLRHPSRIEKVRNCGNDKLIKEVCGD